MGLKGQEVCGVVIHALAVGVGLGVGHGRGRVETLKQACGYGYNGFALFSLVEQGSWFR